MVSPEGATLHHQTITHADQRDHINEVPFPSPVVVTGIRVGAVPSITAQHHDAFVNVFARDLQNTDSARYAKLCDGFMLPTAGNKVVHFDHPIITDRIVLRGRYQTLPLTLLGHTVNEASSEAGRPQGTAKPVPGPISANEALDRWSRKSSKPYQLLNISHNVWFTRETEELLHQLVVYWREIGTSDRHMHHTSLPSSLATAVAKAADAVCDALAARKTHPPSVQPSTTLDGDDSETQGQRPAWLDEALDMAMGWIGLFASKAIGRAPFALEYAQTGLAAAVLLCSSPSTARTMLGRHAMVLFADVLTMPQAPGSYVRHVVAACLLIVTGCGPLGCEAALGWWKPGNIIWTAAASHTKQKGSPPRTQGHDDVATNEEDAAERAMYTEDYWEYDEDDLNIPQYDGADDRWEMGTEAGDGRSQGGNRNGPAGSSRDKRRDKDKDRSRYKDKDRQRSRYDKERDDREAEQQSKDKSRKDRVKEEKEEERAKKRRRSVSPRPLSSRSRATSAAGHEVKEKEREKRRISKSRSPSRGQDKPSTRDKERSSKGIEKKPREPSINPVDRALNSIDQRLAFRTAKYWSAKEREYSGCYAAVAGHVVDLLPPRVATMCLRLLRVLRFYERAALFQSTAREMIDGHRGEGGREKGAGLPTRDVALAVAECTSCLTGLAEALATPTPVLANLSAQGPSKHRLRSDREPEALLLEILVSRRVLPLLSTLLLVPSAHAAQLVAQGEEHHASSAEIALAHQLSVGTKALLSVLCSSRAGVELVASDPGVLPRMLSALQPSGSGAAGTAGSDVAVSLRSLAIAESGIEDLLGYTVGSPHSVAALQTLGGLLDSGAGGRHAVVYALARHAEPALPRLMQLAHVHCSMLRQASGVQLPPGGSNGGVVQLDVCTMLDCAPAYGTALTLLQALTGEGHGDVAVLMVPHAAAVEASSSSELASLDGCEGAGVAHAVAALSNIAGSAQALSKAEANGVEALVDSLHADLPPMAPVPDDPRLRSIPWETIEFFFMHQQAFSRSSTSLRLLTAMMWEVNTGLEAAATVHHHNGNGLDLLLQGILVAAELVEAAQSDRLWVQRTGAAIDAAASAAARRNALEFASVASAAMSVFLQQARSLIPVDLMSTATVEALLRLHALLVSEEESLVCMLSGSTSSSPGPALTARFHAASALRCFVEAAEWGPELITTILLGVGSAATDARPTSGLGPSQLFTATCLLGDLFPTEWPAPGRKAGHPPPTHRKYRTALAKGIEACSGPFQRLLSHCCASEPLLLRASGVRVIARAAGLGGGMGPFVIAPLVEALRTVPASQVPLHDAKRVLEMVVPLAYRPAIKAALLDSDALKLLANILTMVMPHLNSPDDASEAASVCTMALEAAMVLCNPEVGLNPMAPKEQVVREEMPTTDKAVPLATCLLRSLPATGANSVIGHRILRLLASSDHGRAALRQGAVALHAKTEGRPPPAGPLQPAQVAQAAQWIATSYWKVADSLPPGSESMKTSFIDVVTIMQEACAAMEGDQEVEVPTAPARFVAALQMSLAAAIEASLAAEETRWDGIAAAQKICGMVYDPVTRMFWKNVKARSVESSAASSSMVMRKYARLECAPDAAISVAGTLHPPLTRPTRPLFEWVDAAGADIIGSPDAGDTAQQVQVGTGGGIAPSPQQAQQVKSPAALHGIKASPRHPGPPPLESPITTTVAAVPPAPVVAKAPSPSPLRQQPIAVPVVAPDLGDLDLYADLGLGEDSLGLFATTTAAATAIAAPPAVEPKEESLPSPVKMEEEAEAVGEEAGATTEEHPVGAEEDTAAPAAEQAERKEEDMHCIDEQQQQQASPATKADVDMLPTEDLPSRSEQQQQGEEKEEVLPEPSAHQEAQAPVASPPASPLPTDPKALAALLQDPVKVQQLLERNPALLSILKSKMKK